MIKRLEKIERAVELKGLGQPQADIDKTQSQAIASLLEAVEKIPNAAIQAGSIILVKTTLTSGPTIKVKTLSQRELIHLENNQKLLLSPADLLENLSSIFYEPDRLNHLDGNVRPSTNALHARRDTQTERALLDPSQGL